MLNQSQLRLTTDATAAGDDVDCRMTEMTLQNVLGNVSANLRDNYTRIRVEIAFFLGNATGSEMFCGIMQRAQGALAAIPVNTFRFAGVIFDDSVGNNWFLNGANGVTLDDNDTGVAADGTQSMVRIDWTANASQTLTLFQGTDLRTVVGGPVTVVGINRSSGEIHFFIQNEGAAAETLTINSVSIEWL